MNLTKPLSHPFIRLQQPASQPSKQPPAAHVQLRSKELTTEVNTDFYSSQMIMHSMTKSRTEH